MPNKPDSDAQATLERSAVSYIAPAQAAALAGISVRTLARIADRGDLTIAHPTGSRHRRYIESEVRALMNVPEASPHASGTPTQGDAA